MTVEKGCKRLSDLPGPVVDRFRTLLATLHPDANGCLIWPRLVNKDGYGQVVYRTPSGNRQIAAHRLAKLLEVDEIPPMMVTDHLCRVRTCVNADHLRVATIAENTQAGIAGYANPLKTHCPSGHPYSLDNVRIYTRPNGGETRICRECNRLKAARHRRKIATRTN